MPPTRLWPATAGRAFVGNVSLREGRPFLHAHATFADADGEPSAAT